VEETFSYRAAGQQAGSPPKQSQLAACRSHYHLLTNSSQIVTGRDIRTAHDAGGTITDIECNSGHWTTESLNYYVAAKMLWAPGSEPQTWVDRFCRLGFGEGASSMRAYFGRCAKLHAKVRALPRDRRPSRRAPGLYAGIWTVEWFDASALLIDRALEAAAGDERAVARVKRYRTALDITRFRVKYFSAKAAWARAVADYNAAKDKRAVRAALEAARKKWTAIEEERKSLYRKHVDTWILNTCYLGFYGT
jgi:hypothetical protein